MPHADVVARSDDVTRSKYESTRNPGRAADISPRESNIDRIILGVPEHPGFSGNTEYLNGNGKSVTLKRKSGMRGKINLNKEPNPRC